MSFFQRISRFDLGWMNLFWVSIQGGVFWEAAQGEECDDCDEGGASAGISTPQGTPGFIYDTDECDGATVLFNGPFDGCCNGCCFDGRFRITLFN